MKKKSTQKESTEPKQKPVYDEPQLRPAFERMYHVFMRTKKGGFPNATDLGKELDAAPETVQKDIQFMRDRLKLPIKYNDKEHGFYFTQPVGSFPGMEVTDETVQALAFFRSLAETVPSPMLVEKMLEMYNEIVSTLDERRKMALEIVRNSVYFQQSGIDIVDPKTFETVLSSIWEERVMQHLYRKPQGTFIQRLLEPWAIVVSRGAWYVMGFCGLAKARRTFLLSRLRAPKLMRQKYTIPESFNAKEYFDKCFGVQSGDGDYKVVVKHNPRLAAVHETRMWHPSQEREDLPDGSALLTFRVSCLAEIKYQILDWAEDAIVLEPPELVQDVIGSLRKMCANYGIACAEPGADTKAERLKR